MKKILELASERVRGLSLLLAACLLLQTPGCAMMRDPDPPMEASLTVRGEIDRDRRGNLSGDLEAYSTLKGVLIGTVTGLPSGVVTGSSVGLGVGVVTCAPTAILAVLCIPVAIFTGAVVGGVVGTLGGGVLGYVGGLPGDTARAVTQSIAEMEEGRRFESELQQALLDRLPSERIAGDGTQPGIELEARLAEFDLRQHASEKISIRLDASMTQRWEDERGRARQNRCRYRYDSERRPAESWLEAGDGSFGAAMTRALETFALWMERDLEAFETRTERAKTEEDPASCYREKRWYRLY